MNRRRFIQSLAAVFSMPAMPALPLNAATAALPTAVSVPAKARFWSIYMSGLHGECPPHALQSILNIPEVDAKRYVSQLIADGVLKPNPLLQKSVSNILKSKENRLLDKVKKRSQMKSQAKSTDVKICETADATHSVDGKVELPEDIPEADLEVVSEGEPVEAETLLQGEPEVQS